MSQPQPQHVTLVLGEGGDAAPAPSEAPLAPQRPAAPITTRTNTVGLGDRLSHVFREIRPLVEHARMGNNSRLSLPTWLPRTSTQPMTHYTSETGIDRPQSSTVQVNLGPGSQTYMVNERLNSPLQRQQSDSSVLPSTPTSEVPDRVANQDNTADVNIAINPSNNNNIPDNAENDIMGSEDEQQVLDIRAFLNVLVKYSPFYLILLVKFMYDRREGLFTFFTLLITFYHGNLLVKREYGKQANRDFGALFFELIYTVGSVAIVHLLFGHHQLLENVVMFKGYEQIDVWTLIWLVCLTDLIVKILTVDLKIIVTALPAAVLPFQKRGKVYLFIEAVSQLYRSTLPIQPWMTYLLNSYTGTEKMIGMFLATTYVIAKVVELLFRLKLFKNATWTLLQSVNLGTKPTGEQMGTAGDACPICHDEYTTPVRLSCAHIFCELCIATWLDREHTCPLCRAKVSDEPTWRDGSTSHYFQLY